ELCAMDLAFGVRETVDLGRPGRGLAVVVTSVAVAVAMPMASVVVRLLRCLLRRAGLAGQIAVALARGVAGLGRESRFLPCWNGGLPAFVAFSAEATAEVDHLGVAEVQQLHRRADRAPAHLAVEDQLGVAVREDALDAPAELLVRDHAVR